MIPKKKAKIRFDDVYPNATYPPCEVHEHNSVFSVAEKFIEIERNLSSSICKLAFVQPVAHIYNPIEYAYTVHNKYVYTYCRCPKKVMFLGMNPGPWGMSQTGVPFGEVNVVKDWMGISGEIAKPVHENPLRPVMGFACKRSEISGQRFWSLFRELSGDARTFFENSLVYNHCPVAFMTENGKNITPNELKRNERNNLYCLCDEALTQVIDLYKISVIIAIGRFAEKRAKCVLRNMESIKVVNIPHPSPRNFGNSLKWKETVVEILQKNSLLHYFKRPVQQVSIENFSPELS